MKNSMKVAPTIVNKNRIPRKALWKKEISIEEAAKSRKLKNPRALNQALGALQEQMGNYENARISYIKVLKEEPRSVDAVLGIARIDLLAGRTREAERGFRKAVSLQPDDPHVRASFGQFLVSQNRWTEAVDEMRIASNLAPEKQGYQFALAVALAHADRASEAFPLLAKTVGEAEAHYNIGYIYFQNKEFDRASREFRQALMLKPDLEQAIIMQQEIVKLTELDAPHRSAIKPVSFERPSSSQNGEISFKPGIRTSHDRQTETSKGENPADDDVSDYFGHSRPVEN